MKPKSFPSFPAANLQYQILTWSSASFNCRNRFKQSRKLQNGSDILFQRNRYRTESKEEGREENQPLFSSVSVTVASKAPNRNQSAFTLAFAYKEKKKKKKKESRRSYNDGSAKRRKTEETRAASVFALFSSSEAVAVNQWQVADARNPLLLCSVFICEHYEIALVVRRYFRKCHSTEELMEDT